MRFNPDNSLTGERLSLFGHDAGMGRGVRLWRRIVTDKYYFQQAFSAMMAGRYRDIAEGFDYDFYDVKYNNVKNEYYGPDCFSYVLIRESTRPPLLSTH
ncbi:hypothetical protein DdX_17422 [Ditylenchus destructor]|uniref:Uncharacterized protein n=1 Tax=Ditylenchus destructor TaxID=166010 RepID=A0AAD4MN19_9BILA|nr:hypothetical protein DdX_17422 [Ditylenchus destructor]